MGFLFKTKREREREQRRRRRRAFREAENRIDDVRDRIKKMDRESKTAWSQARDALKSGQKAAAQRALTSYRAAQVLITKLEQKRWVFEQYITKMDVARSDKEFAEALNGINRIMDIQPEQVEDVFEASQDILAEDMDANHFWTTLYTREMDGATGALEDHIPSMDELLQLLQDEASAEVGGGTAERVSEELEQRMKSGQERVKKLLDGK